MRRILLIVLVALLPLQWSGAAAAVLCLHGEAGHGHAHGDAALRHAGHGHAADGHAATGHADHGTRSHGHAAHDHGAHSGEASPDGPLADLGHCGHADCGGCCHGGGSLPAAAQSVPWAPPFGAAPRARIDASPASPALDGPFRPPRVRSA